MSNRTMARWWRQQWPNPRLSDADLAALGAAPKASRLLRLLSTDPLVSLELALLTQNAVWDAPLNPAIELAGRGYRRPLVGPLMVDGPGPWRWCNQLQILFPQAKDDWGLASYVAVLQTGIDAVLATAPIANPPFAVVAEDQPTVAAGALVIGGVRPNTRRPYGAGRYGESLYGGWPSGGAVFFCRLEAIDYEWATLPNECAPWADITLISGGCAA